MTAATPFRTLIAPVATHGAAPAIPIGFGTTDCRQGYPATGIERVPWNLTRMIPA